MAAERDATAEVPAQLAMGARNGTAPAAVRPGHGATVRRGGRRRGARSAATVLLACLLAAWAPVTSAIPVVTEIEVVPARVTVGSDPTSPTRFVLEARLWTWFGPDRSGISPKAGVTVTWSISPSIVGLHFDGTPTGFRATLVLDPGVELPGPVTVKAEAGGIGADSYLVPGGTGGDFVRGAYSDDVAPDAILLHAMDANNNCVVSLAPAMIRIGNLGDLTNNCNDGATWGTAVLSAAHAAQVYDANWTGDVDEVDASAAPGLRSVPVVLRVFLGGTDSKLKDRQDTAQVFTLLEMDDADSVFKDSRTGIDLDLVDAQIVPAPVDETSVDGCAAGDAQTKSYDYVDSAAPPGTPLALHVYVLDDLGGLVDGFTCPATSQRRYPVIYLREAQHSGTILLHELGHALGLDLPGAGHSDEMDGFDAANVMVSGYAQDMIWRRRFTAGQVLRMNIEAGSWLNWADGRTGTKVREVSQARMGCQCGKHDNTGQCPRLVDDLAKPRGSVSKLSEWDCFDLIRLYTGDTTDSPAALLAGRLWGTDLTACRWDLVTTPFDIDKVPWVMGPNVTAPGNCPQWVAVFFRNHAAVFQNDLAGVSGTWGDAADSRQLDPAVVSRRAIRVHVHYAHADETAVKSEIEGAGRVFGPDNRTGLDLTLLPEEETDATALANCPVPPQANEYSVCYSSGAGTTVAELVGKALGLPDPSATERTAPTFAANAFQAPADRGSRLTLGQVFRIYSKLPQSGFPDCTPSTSVCPPLEEDIER
jgi:hypothetical protein